MGTRALLMCYVMVTAVATPLLAISIAENTAHHNHLEMKTFNDAIAFRFLANRSFVFSTFTLFCCPHFSCTLPFTLFICASSENVG